MIKAAAIRYPDGKVLTSHRHAHIIKKYAGSGATAKSSRTGVQGFITTSGYFVNRKDAALIAIESGQVPEDYGDTLFSEDVWDSEGKELLTGMAA